MFYSKNLKKFKIINHCFFTRNGGISKGIYRSLNCGKGSNDKKKNLINNLKFVSNKIGVKLRNLKLMHQTHSNKVILLKKKDKSFKRLRSDAVVTNIKGYALGVVTADCVPIILYNSNNGHIGCIHAGWRGAISGIVAKTITKLTSKNGINKIFASIGPCIGKNSYEVDLNFYKMFLIKSKKNSIYFSSSVNKKKLFDLRKYVSDKLLKLKVRVDHVNHDTFKDKSNFFSYRRSQKLQENDYGRCISVISLIK